MSPTGKNSYWNAQDTDTSLNEILAPRDLERKNCPAEVSVMSTVGGERRLQLVATRLRRRTAARVAHLQERHSMRLLDGNCVRRMQGMSTRPHSARSEQDKTRPHHFQRRSEGLTLAAHLRTLETPHG